MTLVKSIWMTDTRRMKSLTQIDLEQTVNSLREQNNQLNHVLTTTMTLRDQFAIAALNGWLSQHDINQYDPDCFSKVTEIAYKLAAAMLKERSKPL